jgi:hypothetical protein
MSLPPDIIEHPFVPGRGADDPVPFVNPEVPEALTVGFVVGHCGHRVSLTEWRAGLRNCEHCPTISAGSGS